MGAFTNTFTKGSFQIGVYTVYDALLTIEEGSDGGYFMTEEDDSDYYLQLIPD